MTLPTISVVHTYVNSKHCQNCFNAYRNQYRIFNKQKNYYKPWTETEREANRALIAELKSIGVQLQIFERDFKDHQSIFVVDKFSRLETETICWVCEKSRKVLRVLERTISIPKLVLRIPYDNLISKTGKAACSHSWSYTRKRLLRIAKDFKAVCDCNFVARRRNTFKSYVKRFGICKACRELVRLEFPSL